MKFSDTEIERFLGKISVALERLSLWEAVQSLKRLDPPAFQGFKDATRMYLEGKIQEDRYLEAIPFYILLAEKKKVEEYRKGEIEEKKKKEEKVEEMEDGE